MGYADPRKAVNTIYERHKEFFREDIDKGDLSLRSAGGAQNTRVFSERGVLKVLRYSNTEMANAVMDEVFDVYLAVRKKAKEQAASLAPTASGILADWLKMAALLEVPKHLAQVEAVKATKAKTGVDCSPLLLVAPAQDNIPNDEIYLEVSKIGEQIGESGQKVNNFLAEQGLQWKEGKV